MQRLFLAVLTAALTLAGLTPAAADDFRFEGHGWGHGIGMTQYGALGQAEDGRSAEQIVEYYYQGATVAKPSLGLGAIKIGLSQNRTSLTITARGGKATVRFAGKDTTVADGEVITLKMFASDGKCYLTQPATAKRSANACSATVTYPDAAVDLSSEPYRYGHGKVLLEPNSKDPSRFHVINQLPDLQTYIYGLAEVPSSWPMEALKAQAIAGRSYAAYALLGTSGPSSLCGCHLYDSVSSQVYAGITRETDRWRSAVDATRGQVVYASGAAGTRNGVVQAFYSSSSGGRTENVEDVWYSSTPRPFYSSVDDPWSLRASNPRRSWVTSVPEATIRSKVGLDDVRSIAVRERNTSGSARTVVFSGVKGGVGHTVTKDGQWVRSNLGLNSAWIQRVFLPPFVDDDGSRFEADIAWVAAEGITKGCNPPANDHYCPADDVSRKQMAAFIVRALGLTETSDAGRFSDVPSGSTFAADINKLATAGITKGCNPPANDRFCPDQDVKRKQMAAFIVRALGLTETSDAGRFSDVPSGSTFAGDINKLATAGITSGCGGDRFCPDAAVSREQMAAFLHRGFKG